MSKIFTINCINMQSCTIHVVNQSFPEDCISSDFTIVFKFTNKG